jgi:hypothetical protein
VIYSATVRDAKVYNLFLELIYLEFTRSFLRIYNLGDQELPCFYGNRNSIIVHVENSPWKTTSVDIETTSVDNVHLIHLKFFSASCFDIRMSGSRRYGAGVFAVFWNMLMCSLVKIINFSEEAPATILTLRHCRCRQS